MRLEQFFDRIKREEQAILAISGDLTTVGNSDEFSTADEYLGRVLRPPKGNYVGLKTPRWANICVPGNHDHWPGAPVILGPPSGEVAKRFKLLPDQNLLKFSTGTTIRLLRIDSDADVSPYGSNRVLARGAFRSQLQKLSGNLGVPEDKEIRVLLLHHSYSAAGVTLSMTSASKGALKDFIIEHDISVLLCGHIHQPPLTQVLEATHLKQTVKFLEARCGTTTQLSTLPYDWTTITGERPARQDHWPNTLLVHRLYDDGSTVHWESETHIERSVGFRPVGELLPNWPSTIRVVLWPRANRGQTVP